MQDKTVIGNNEHTNTPSKAFREYIESLVEEIVINNAVFNDHKKYLQRYSQEEGLDYVSLKKNLTEFFETIEELKSNKSKSIERLAKMLAKDCFLEEIKVDELIAAIDEAREKKAKRIAAEKKVQEERIAALKKVEEERIAREKAEHEAAEEARRKAEEEAERNARKERERKAREKADKDREKAKKAKEKEESKEKIELLLRSTEEDWNWVSLWGNSSPLKYIMLDKETKSVAIALRRNNGKPKEITIPSTFTDHYPYNIRFNVTSIYDYAFMECDWLESITIPSSVKYIGQRAFMNCRSLSKIVFQGGTILVNQDSFENTPFVNSPAYQEAVKKGIIVVASGTSMIETPPRLHPYFTIYDKKYVWEVLPESKPPITPMDLVIPAKAGDHFIRGIRGFEDCETVRSIVFRSRPFLEIGYDAFSCCRNLESVVFESIPDLVIRRRAFAGCSKLSSLTFTPNDTGKTPFIEDDAFHGCKLPLSKKIEVKRYEWKSVSF